MRQTEPRVVLLRAWLLMLSYSFEMAIIYFLKLEILNFMKIIKTYGCKSCTDMAYFHPLAHGLDVTSFLPTLAMHRYMLCCCMASCNVVIPRKSFLWGSRQPFFGVLHNKSLVRYYSKSRLSWVEIKMSQVFLNHWPCTGICCVFVLARAKMQFHENPSYFGHFPAFCFGTLFLKRYSQLSKSIDITTLKKNPAMHRYMLCDMTIGN